VSKRVCFIGGGLKGGGQERGLTSLANYLADSGYHVSIINLFKTEQFYSLNDNIQTIWPAIVRMKHNRFVYAILLIPFVRRSIREIKPDVLLGFGEWFNPFIILSTRLLNTPLFVFDRMGPEMKMDPIVRLARRVLYHLADGVIVQTSIAAGIVAKETGARNIAVIPNPVNTINVLKSAKRNQIVTLGRLSPEKGHLILIRAFSRIPHTKWSLHIIGDGQERNNLEKETSLLGLSDRVKFYGHLVDFGKIFAESDIFVLPSLYEGFPNALIEAMSVPLACISSNCVAGPSDIIEEEKNGLLVEPGNVEILSDAINKLIEHPELRDKLAGEAYKIRETLAFDRIAKLYLDFIFSS